MNDSGVRSFVESSGGGRVTRIERAATGASRVTWLVDVEGDDAARRLVVRCDTGDGPLSGTELSLARESVVYRALATSGVRIPRLVAVNADATMLLVERASGAANFSELSDAELCQEIAGDYFVALAELHGVDAAKLELPGLSRSSSASEGTRLDLALWRRICDDRVGDEPLLVLAFDSLECRVPESAAPASLCHGDAGPGNFLFEDNRVTALLDWEFAHCGDPLDDLAWVSVRAQLLGGFSDLGLGFRTWERASGRPAEREAIEFYRALVLLRMAVSCCIGLGHAGARAMDATVYELLLPYLRMLLPQALQRAGCGGAALTELARDAEATISAHPVLRAHARTLDELPA